MSNSVVVDYAERLAGVSPESVARASIAERASIVGPYEHRGVRISMLNLSSGNPTGTFKDWLACVTIAYCLERGITEFVTQTSGNTGNALVRYAEPHGIKVHVFYPRDSAYKIQPQVASASRSAFYELVCTELELKAHTARFAEEQGLPWLPNFDHQIQANKVRAYFLHDWCARRRVTFTWHAQALSSAYGIFGFYRGLDELRAQGEKVSMPRLLGAHQGAVAPYYDHLYGGAPPTGEAVLEPTLFRSQPPPELLGELAEIVDRWGGLVSRVTAARFDAQLDQALEVLRHLQLSPCISPITNDFTEKAPLIALIAVLEQIERGVIASGEEVLVVGTGGFGVVPSHRFSPRPREIGIGGAAETPAVL